MIGLGKNKTTEEKVSAPSADERSEKEQKIEEIVGFWWNEHINGSVVAQHSEGWNHLVVSLKHLIKALKLEI